MDTHETEPTPAAAHEPDAGDETVTSKGRLSRRQLLVNVVIGGGGLALLVAALFSNKWRTKDEMPGLAFVIPEGAGAKVANSTLVSAIALPTEIVFEPGDNAAISVRNDDTVPLRAGPFVVLPGQTYTQRFPNPGEFNIACTVDPAESITVTVKE